MISDQYPNGWKRLVEPLIEMCNRAHVEILQIKQKFGGLRFYVGLAPAEVSEAIREAETRSFTICEECGERGQTLKRHEWLRTLCPRHASELGFK